MHANGTPKREPSGSVACGENEDSSRARGELRSRGRRGRSPSGNLDLRGFEDPNENFVQLVNSVPARRTSCPNSPRPPGSVDFLGPPMGAHNEEIYGGELGFPKERLQELRDAGII
jgi:hypothetical protein